MGLSTYRIADSDVSDEAVIGCLAEELHSKVCKRLRGRHLHSRSRSLCHSVWTLDDVVEQKS